MSSHPSIVVALEDRARLLQLASVTEEQHVAELLEAEIERAQVLPLGEVPGDVIVMDSDVEYADVESGERRRLRLVYPHEADSRAARISILAPLGCALLGLRVGQEIDWRMPGGVRRLRVLSVTRGVPEPA